MPKQQCASTVFGIKCNVVTSFVTHLLFVELVIISCIELSQYMYICMYTVVCLFEASCNANNIRHNMRVFAASVDAGVQTRSRSIVQTGDDDLALGCPHLTEKRHCEDVPACLR